MLKVLTIVAVSLLSTGCASIVSGQNQSISVVTQSEGSELLGANCSLENDKGSWFATTPGSVTVRRSFKAMQVSCSHQLVETGTSSVASSTKGMVFGNILFGGVIGVGVDAATGAAYDYPETIKVNMGQAKPGKVGPASASAPPVVLAKATQSEATATQVPVPVPASSKYAVQPETVTTAAFAPSQTVLAVPPQTAREVEKAPMPAAVASTPTAIADTANQRILKGGNDAFTVEHMSEARSCASQPRALLTAKGPGYESYVVTCGNGDSLAARCEFGNCRVLR